MHFKLLIAFVENDKTNEVMDAARKAGATGATVISHARGEGMVFSDVTEVTRARQNRDEKGFIVDLHAKIKVRINETEYDYIVN